MSYLDDNCIILFRYGSFLVSFQAGHTDIGNTAITIYFYQKRRREFREVLRSNHSGLTVSRFARLLFFSCSIIVVALPLSLYILACNLMVGITSYSWSATHDPQTWWLIQILPSDTPRFDFFLYPVISLFLFVYFGLGADALLMYRRWMINIGLAKLFPKSKWLNRGVTVDNSGKSVTYGSNVLDSTITEGSTNIATSTSTAYDKTDHGRYEWDSPYDDIDIEKFAGKNVEIVADRSPDVITDSDASAISENNDNEGSVLDIVEYPEGAVRVKYEIRVEK